MSTIALNTLTNFTTVISHSSLIQVFYLKMLQYLCILSVSVKIWSMGSMATPIVVGWFASRAWKN